MRDAIAAAKMNLNFLSFFPRLLLTLSIINPRSTANITSNTSPNNKEAVLFNAYSE